MEETDDRSKDSNKLFTENRKSQNVCSVCGEFNRKQKTGLVSVTCIPLNNVRNVPLIFLRTFSNNSISLRVRDVLVKPPSVTQV